MIPPALRLPERGLPVKGATPYVHTLFRAGTPVESGDFDPLGVVFVRVDGYHALFAAQVIVRPFERVEAHKWGLTTYHLLQEVMDRQRRFLASLQGGESATSRPNPHLKTAGLRYLCRPGSDVMEVVLLGKVFAPDAEQASRLAVLWWQELAALFPYDYELSPVTSPEAFRELSGLSLIESTSLPCRVAEVRRYDMFIPRLDGRAVTEGDYVLFPFVWHPHAMEQVWRAMALLPCQTLVGVTLRPTWLYEAEEVHLGQLYASATRLAASDDLSLRLQGELAARLYAGYVNRLRHPCLMRVHIVAAEEGVGPLARAMGTALTHKPLAETRFEHEVPFPGYEVVVPAAGELPVVVENLNLLEFGEWGHDQAARPYRRFRYLFDTTGAHCAFRLPFLPKAGLPGVCFRAEPLDF